MKAIKVFIGFVLTLSSFDASSQIFTATKYYWSVKDFNKDVALYRAKSFVLKNVLKVTEDVVKFEMDPLASSSSGELTSLVYNCEKQNKEGLLLGFFGEKWNPSGVVYQAYAFKDFPTTKALDLLNKLESVMKENSKYLAEEAESNNITFSYDDLTFVLTPDIQGPNIRVFWDDFDANWDNVAFRRTKRRLLKKLD